MTPRYKDILVYVENVEKGLLKSLLENKMIESFKTIRNKEAMLNRIFMPKSP